MTKSKTAYSFALGMLFTVASLVACNSKDSDKKESTTDTSAKMEQTVQPKQDTTAPKMDTATTRPVKEGN
ncbi:MAG: hypothetical protein JST17_15660 [Bacteroidetes bacterium]|nr:hypothetical protein [Bacteroidota bacterium]MBS1930619.1 hypothetical protein [Bacteroidota bacterium]